MQDKLNANGQLLLQYLREVHHTNYAYLNQLDSDVLIHDCFRQFCVFLLDTAPLDDWYNDFREYCRLLIAWLNRPAWHVDWILRSVDFWQYAQTFGIPNYF